MVLLDRLFGVLEGVFEVDLAIQSFSQRKPNEKICLAVSPVQQFQTRGAHRSSLMAYSRCFRLSNQDQRKDNRWEKCISIASIWQCNKYKTNRNKLFLRMTLKPITHLLSCTILLGKSIDDKKNTNAEAFTSAIDDLGSATSSELQILQSKFRSDQPSAAFRPK